MTEGSPVKRLGIEKFLETYDISREDIRSVRDIRNTRERYFQAAELLAQKQVPRYGSLEIGIILYDDTELQRVREAVNARLAELFRDDRPVTRELNIPYTQYLRLLAGGSATNMHTQLGYVVHNSRLVRNKEKTCTFSPSYEDWHFDTCIPDPIDKDASFVLGAIWRRGSVQEYAKKQLQLAIYAPRGQADALEEVVARFHNVFHRTLRSLRATTPVQYGEKHATFAGAHLEINSKAIATFLADTAGLPVGSVFADERTNLPSIAFDPTMFLAGYNALDGKDNGVINAANKRLAAALKHMVREQGRSAKFSGKTSTHSVQIKVN